ncbi:flavin reductase (DIM6/NTAB) family NADH-FMN oxidoreductase RutF [Lipingzhangella halophila]|uniref:Flavin reductase (DIM6/NTAB) family NADH-FMN oxidoreductase RutF n=1 Tax=Lipingzhangella halophila TaxID=1783352 RepID=A0A7W7W2T5_9ACTN|nr:flavin reductase family protein [Lipingzhangella halophila]MBB4932307.1 flavin reductase (DIM6/NTAB) family NADH-FMN oxidoreductase RutF [Lipingzhangella halophila]
MAHLVLDPAEMPAPAARKLLIGSVVPRPIAWTSTVSRSGVPNLAPFSFFTVASTCPQMLTITIEPHDSGAEKDTLANIRETGEFVVNVVPEQLGNAMRVSADVGEGAADEFAIAGLTAAPSHLVAASRVAETPAAVECRLERMLRLGTDTMVIGRVACYHMDPAVLDDRGRVDNLALRALGRLGGGYIRTDQAFGLPKSQDDRSRSGPTG